MRKIIVTGGRDYDDVEKIYKTLDLINPDTIIHGGATGADLYAKSWGLGKAKEVICYSADWDTHGKAAGPLRNRKMIYDNPDAIVVAFPGGRGTINCIETAIQHKLIVLRVT